MKNFTRHFSAKRILSSRMRTWAYSMMAGTVTLREDRERGDVPGWVMITLMSALLVAGLLAIASPALEDLFEQAMSKVGS